MSLYDHVVDFLYMDESHTSAEHLQESESTAEFKPLAEDVLQLQQVSHATVNQSNDRLGYNFSIEDAERYFLDRGYEVASRTISHYCQSNKFTCKKFTSAGVRRWFIKNDSIEKHLRQMKRDNHKVARESKRPHANGEVEKNTEIGTSTKNANANAKPRNESQAIADPEERYIVHLEKQIEQKDLQINALLSQGDELALIAKGLGGLLASPKESSDKNNYRGTGENNSEGEGE